MGARDRSIRFVFDSVVDAYVSGRPELPVEVVREASAAVEAPPGARVLEVGAGTGQLTHALLTMDFDVTALEPGDALRSRAAVRAPGATFVASTFEDFCPRASRVSQGTGLAEANPSSPAFEPYGRFDAVFSSNAFHWIEPEIGYAKAADLADAIVLIWNTPFVADADLRRRIQEGVMISYGSSFPTEEAGVREFVASEMGAVRSDLSRSSRFEEPWSTLHERRLEYPRDRFLDLIGSMGYVAASGRRDEIRADLRPIIGADPLELIDLVWSIAARSR